MSQNLSSALETRLQPDEEVEHVSNMDMRTYLAGHMGSVVGSLITGIIVGVFVFVFGTVVLGPAVGLLAAIVLAIGIGLYPLIRAFIVVKWGSIDYAITDRRFIVIRDTVFETTEKSVMVDRVRDADLKEDFWDKMLDNGDIYIEGTRGDSLRFQNASDPNDLYEEALKKIEEVDEVDDYNA